MAPGHPGDPVQDPTAQGGKESPGCLGWLGFAIVVLLIIGGIGSLIEEEGSDSELLDFATGMGDQISWTEGPVELTDDLEGDDERSAWVQGHTDSGTIDFYRYEGIRDRKSAEADAEGRAVGCTDVLVFVNYEDEEEAKAASDTILSFLTFLADGDCDTRPENRPEPTIQRSPEEVLFRAIRDELGDSNRDAEFRLNVNLSEETGTLIVTWSINDNLTAGMTRSQARREATDILEAVHESGVPYTSITLEGTFRTMDTLGNTGESIFVRSTYGEELVASINFDNFNPGNVFQIGYDTYVHPEFVG